jgi:DNA ligase-1
MKTLIHFNDFVDEMVVSASRKHKQDVLTKYKDDEVIKRYLKIAYDPYVVFGISTKKLSKMARPTDWFHAATVFELFDYLTAHNTGTLEDVAACQEMMFCAAELDGTLECLLSDLICKDLSIGCDAKTINSVIPGLIPTFNVMLAEKFFDKPERVEGKEFALTTKIDGGRIIAIKENGSVSFFTRAGQKYEGLVDLENELKEILDDNFVLDGEITLLDPRGLSSKDQYKETMKITRKDGEKHGVKMLVFDYMPVANFKMQNCPVAYSARRAHLSTMFDLCALKYFELLPLLYVGSDVSVIPKCLDEAIADGQEGIMINICDAPYEFKRTWNLLKVKKMNTMDLQIIGFEEGTGRLAGTLGAILVRYKNGNTVKVGSGFTDWLRTEIWNNRGKYIDAIVEIKYFEETTNQEGGESLRFPIFNDFRPDKLEADF